MRTVTPKKDLIILFLIIGMVVFLHENVSADNCLDVWSSDNSRNMVENPGFEEDTTLDNWKDPLDSPTKWPRDPEGVKTSFDDTTSHTGSGSLKVTWDGSFDFQNYFHVSQTFNVIPGITYRLSGYIKTENIYSENHKGAKRNGARIEVIDPINGWSYFDRTTAALYGTLDWKKVGLQFKVPENTTKIMVRPRRFVDKKTGKSFGTAWWDDIQLLPVPQINKVRKNESQIIIEGNSFGNDPGPGKKGSEENCVLYDGVCVSETLIQSWSDSAIVIDNIGDGAIIVKSGGIVSNIKTLEKKFLLSNGTIIVKFPDIVKGEGIGQITDIGTGRQFLDDTIAPPLYEFTVKDKPFSKRKKVYSSKDASMISRTYTNKDGLQTLTITANHCEGFIVTATIHLPSTHGGLQFSINIQNSGKKTIQSVRYPIIAAKSKLGKDSKDDAIVNPFFEGYLLKNPASVGSTAKYKDKEYPGSMTVQMMAYYDLEQPEAGLYLSMDDSSGYKKRFGFDRIKKGALDHILFSFLHVISENPGNQLLLSYHVNIDTFSGDWYDAADRYKQWAITQPWTATKLVDRNDIPQWLYDIQVMIDCYRCRPNRYVDIVKYYKNILGVSNILLYPGGFWGYRDGYYTDTNADNIPDSDPVEWSAIDYFSDNPVYSESEAGSPPYKELKMAIDELRNQSADVLLFLSGMFWDQYYFKLSENHEGFNECTLMDQYAEIPDAIKFIDDRDDYYTYGSSYSVVTEKGNVKYKNWGRDKYCRIRVTMCVGSDSDNVLDMVLYNNIKRGIDHGARLMSLDQLVSGHIDGCWNPAHGHPIGEGKWTHDRFISILNSINKIIGDKGKYGDFGFAMEDPHELYLPYLQFQYVRHSDLNAWGGNKKIPLFNYIYKGYYLGVERGMALRRKNDLDSRWSLAMDFIQGNIQGTMVSFSHPDRDLITFYRRLIKMKRKEYYKARMLHPPVFKGLPDETTIVRNGNTFFVDPIVTNVLKTDDNTISYLLVNANIDRSGTYDIQFNINQYDLPDNRVNLKIIKNGKEIDSQRDVLLPIPITVSLSGGDVAAVVVKYGDWSK